MSLGEKTINLCGFIYTVNVVDFDPGRKAKIYGDPDDCYESEDGTCEWELLSMIPEEGCEADEWPKWEHIDDAVYELMIDND